MFGRIFKKIMFITMICIGVFIWISIKDTDENSIVETISRGDSHNFLYERVGSDKGIFLYSSSNGVRKVSSLYSDYSYIDRDIKISVIKEGRDNGVYISDLNNNIEGKKDLIINGYETISEIQRFSSNIYFICKSNIETVLVNYNTLTGDKTLKKIPIGNNSYIRDIKFINPNEIIYSKKIVEPSDTYNIYSYKIQENIESNIINYSIDMLDPTLSPNRKLISYLKRDSGAYQLYILNLKDKSEKRILLNDGVVSGTVKWSRDSRYILCNTYNDGFLNKMNVVNLESGKLSIMNNAYSGLFSEDSSCILFASYSDKERLQYIYSYNLKTEEKKEVYSVFEEGSFSKSLRLLKVY
ncbi:MAG: hypothetical protein RR838_01765 [Clostridium sp.]